jgi:hypothetical protein
MKNATAHRSDPDGTKALQQQSNETVTPLNLQKIEPSSLSVEEANVRKLRRHNRTRTSIRAILYRGTSEHGTFQPTTIRNASIGGLGLFGAAGLMTGDTVNVRLLSGRTYSGKVCWWCNNHCGVAFSELLDKSDQLLDLAARRAR